MVLTEHRESGLGLCQVEDCGEAASSRDLMSRPETGRQHDTVRLAFSGVRCHIETNVHSCKRAIRVTDKDVSCK